jgi:hypothetical protein
MGDGSRLRHGPPVCPQTGGKSRALRDGDVLHVLMALAMRVGVLSRVGRPQAEGRHGYLDGASGRRQRNETDESSLSSESNHG